MRAAGPSYRVAIVGLGPRGLYALERLLDRARALPVEARIRICAYEPHPTPGAGPIYDPSQPDYLRMNFAAEMIDMWWPGEGLLPASRRTPFSTWCRDHGGGEERYPARSVVGTYLANGLQELLESAPPQVEFELVPRRVSRVEPSGGAWRVTEEGSDATTGHDEVLLTTGHLPAAPPAPGAEEPGVPAGATVAIRGLALTALDAILVLTEGRGGRFTPSKDHPYRLSYAPAGDEPRTILPFSRSGRPMLVKPDPDLAVSTREVAEAGRTRLRDCPAPLPLQDGLLDVLTDTAAAMLEVRGQGEEPSAVTAELMGRLRASPDPGGGALRSTGRSGSVRDELERSLAVGTGLAAPDVPWALGEAWRSIYPAIIERVGGNGLAEDAWPAFLRLAREMERIAFGPPVVNGAKLLALIDAGVVDTSLCAGAEVVSRADGHHLLGAGGETREISVLVDAVSPPPGVRHLQAGPVFELLRAGLVRVPAGRRGVEIGADACCVGASGRPTPGLAALGRISEDWVVGNDSLSRRLHPHSDAWARAAIGRAGEAFAHRTAQVRRARTKPAPKRTTPVASP